VGCPKCREGELLQRRGKFGRPFFGCNRYPKCDYLVNDLAEVANYVPGAEPVAVAAAPSSKAAKPAAKPAAKASTAKTGASRAAKPAAKASTTKSASKATTKKPATRQRKAS
jgi:DNA topoisomerase-1